MGKIVISTNVSLDGVVQDPDGAEGFRLGGWFAQDGGKDLEEWGKVEYAEALRTEALLLGRRSDEWFGTRWASRPGEWADRLNSLPKYVVSSTLEEPRWTNVTVLKGNVVDEVTRLKRELGGDIVVYGTSCGCSSSRSCSWLASASSARPAARSRSALPAAGPSVTASPSSPTRSSETPSCRCVDVGRRAPSRGHRPPPCAPHHARRVAAPDPTAGPQGPDSLTTPSRRKRNP